MTRPAARLVVWLLLGGVGGWAATNRAAALIVGALAVVSLAAGWLFGRMVATPDEWDTLARTDRREGR